MTRKTFDAYLVTYDKYDHDFNLIAQGVAQGFATQEDAFNYAMELNLKSITTDSKVIFKVEFKRYRITLKDHIIGGITNDHFERIFGKQGGVK